MTVGLIFDIKEFAIHDGPGLRTTVFMKGCPLRCTWCHNPEGQSRCPQVMKSPSGERVVGREYDPAELARRLNSQAEIFKWNDGGVTFSGGEPLMQSDFVVEVINQLEDMHVLLDTSGYGEREDFIQVASRCDLVYFDLKIVDREKFRKYTGGEIRTVLQNLDALCETGTPFVIRIPLVPGVTDSEKNLGAIAEIILGRPNLKRIDLLPYNRLAGAKYEALGMNFNPQFDEQAEPDLAANMFKNLNLPWRVV